MTYRPNSLNGEEVRQIAKLKAIELIESLPLLRVGNAFNLVQFSIGFTMSAFPKDVPVPADKEISFEIEPLDINIEELNKSKEEVQKLENHRNVLVSKLKEVDSYLDTINPQTRDSISLDTVRKPDEVRAENNIPTKIDAYQAVDLNASKDDSRAAKTPFIKKG